MIDRNDYEPYGAIIGKPNFNGIGYTGHLMDGATGLTYMQQRYYDQSIGRFLSVDPVTADAKTGGNFNRYWYANNNPYKFTDPDGRAPTEKDEEARKQQRREAASARQSVRGSVVGRAGSSDAHTPSITSVKSDARLDSGSGRSAGGPGIRRPPAPYLRTVVNGYRNGYAKSQKAFEGLQPTTWAKNYPEVSRPWATFWVITETANHYGVGGAAALTVNRAISVPLFLWEASLELSSAAVSFGSALQAHQLYLEQSVPKQGRDTRFDGAAEATFAEYEKTNGQKP